MKRKLSVYLCLRSRSRICVCVLYMKKGNGMLTVVDGYQF